MTRLEFLKWLRARPHGTCWEWNEQLDASGTKCCTISCGEMVVQATSWEQVQRDLLDMGLA